MTNQGAREYRFKALTRIWTGDAEGNPGRTINTGLLGSIRWWFEVLVRGLGGSACDPSHRKDNKPGPCPPGGLKPHDAGHHCVVCELFGCTGWARKFRFEVLDTAEQVQIAQIKRGQKFKLRFTELRSICPEEWALLDLTLRVIADCGAIGGKTVLKPSDEANRANAPHHRDYGLIHIQERRASLGAFTQKGLEDYIRQDRWRHVNDGNFAWASLDNFWCVKGRYLARKNNNTSSFNRVIGRPEPKQQSSRGNSWVAGRQVPGLSQPQEPESKKVFSFREPQQAQRTFGFVKPGAVDFNEMRKRLKQAWQGFQDSEFLEKRAILQTFLNSAGGANQ